MIRLAIENDIPAINDLLRQVLNVHQNGRPDIFKANAKKYSDEELIAIIRDEDSPIFVYVDDNERVHGYAFCQFLEILNHSILHNCKYLYIDDLCVDNQHQGQHIGRELYEYVVKIARKKGCEKIQLNVWSLNDSAYGFYQKMGLTPLKTTLEQKI